MTTRRAVSYGGLFCLLAAWLASAASTLQNQPGDSVLPIGRGTTRHATDALVNEVQAHAAKLRRACSPRRCRSCHIAIRFFSSRGRRSRPTGSAARNARAAPSPAAAASRAL